jgi:membrane dipeptidase
VGKFYPRLVAYTDIRGDFDGIEAAPVALKDVSEYPKLTEAMLRRGFAEEEIMAVLGGGYFAGDAGSGEA